MCKYLSIHNHACSRDSNVWTNSLTSLSCVLCRIFAFLYSTHIRLSIYLCMYAHAYLCMHLCAFLKCRRKCSSANVCERVQLRLVFIHLFSIYFVCSHSTYLVPNCQSVPTYPHPLQLVPILPALFWIFIAVALYAHPSFYAVACIAGACWLPQTCLHSIKMGWFNGFRVLAKSCV